MAIFQDPNLVMQFLRKQMPATGVIPTPNTGDDNVLPPDPGYMGNQLPFIEVGNKNQMPFPNNRNPNTDFVNRWPQGLPPQGILNDLRPPADTTPPLVRKLYGG